MQFTISTFQFIGFIAQIIIRMKILPFCKYKQYDSKNEIVGYIFCSVPNIGYSVSYSMWIRYLGIDWIIIKEIQDTKGKYYEVATPKNGRCNKGLNGKEAWKRKDGLTYRKDYDNKHHQFT